MTNPQTLEAARRPLTDRERRLIKARIRSFQARGRRGLAMSAPIAGGVVLALWLLTMLASDASRMVITGFWLAVGSGLALWARRDMAESARTLDAIAAGLQSALKMNAADVYDVRARSFAEFEEIEDEGACYAFELSDNRLVFIVGQEFYDSARFPSHDFSLVYVLDEAGQRVDFLLEKRGAKATPARRIPASLKERVDLPEHLEVRPGTVGEIEKTLFTS